MRKHFLHWRCHILVEIAISWVEFVFRKHAADVMKDFHVENLTHYRFIK